jgi:hypothetical protein
MGKTLSEPRIHAIKPRWASLPEVSRTDTMVTFKTRAGKCIVPIAAVEAYRASVK